MVKPLRRGIVVFVVLLVIEYLVVPDPGAAHRPRGDDVRDRRGGQIDPE